jgi:hypothetical protein
MQRSGETVRIPVICSSLMSAVLMFLPEHSLQLKKYYKNPTTTRSEQIAMQVLTAKPEKHLKKENYHWKT